MDGLKFLVLAFVLVASTAHALAQSAEGSAERSEKRPADRIVVVYFHRTQRCPTCLKMGGYAEEAVKTGFVKELEQGRVEFHLVDFQKKENAKLAKAYKISGPTLIVVRVKNNKVDHYEDLDEIWMNVYKKPAFLKYVRENVAAQLRKLNREQREP